MSSTPPPSLIIDKILLFGDDQIEQSQGSHNSKIGFNIAPALQREYWAKIQIITHGYHGYTSELGRCMIDAILDAEMPPDSNNKRGTVKLIIVAFGTNDAVTKDNEKQHVPIDRYIDNVEYIVSRIRQRGDHVKIILVGPALVNELSPDTSLDRSTVRAKEYGEALENFARDSDIPILNLWKEFASSTGWKDDDPIPCKRLHRRRRSSSLDTDRGNIARGSTAGVRYQRNLSRDEHLATLLAEDGVHLSRSGYQLWYQALIRMIRENWPGLDARNMRTVFPDIDDIDVGNLPNTLYRTLAER